MLLLEVVSDCCSAEMLEMFVGCADGLDVVEVVELDELLDEPGELEEASGCVALHFSMAVLSISMMVSYDSVCFLVRSVLRKGFCARSRAVIRVWFSMVGSTRESERRACTQFVCPL